MAEDTSSLIIPLRDAIVASLVLAPALAGVPVLAREPNQLLSDLEAKLTGLGNGVFVFTPLPRRPSANLPGCWFERVECVIRVFENVELNTGLDVFELLERVFRWANPVGPLQLTDANGYTYNPLLPDAETPTAVSDGRRRAYDLVFHTSAGLPPLNSFSLAAMTLAPPPGWTARLLPVLTGSWLQLLDRATGLWTAVWLTAGRLTTGALGPLGGEPAIRVSGGFLELWDTSAMAWRPIWWASGVLATGNPDSAAPDGAPATAVRWQTTFDGTFLQLSDSASPGQWRGFFLANGELFAGPLCF